MQPTQNTSLSQNNSFDAQKTSENEPCLVEAWQGYSVLYKNRYLYSKYSPSETIEKTINLTEILPSSLVLVFSPILGYGIESLLKKIDSQSTVVAIETDRQLYDFSLKTEQSFLNTNKKLLSEPNFSYCCLENYKEVENYFSSVDFSKKIRKCKHIKCLDLSAILTESKSFYERTYEYAFLVLSQFWKNRMTLTRLGKLYSKNIFKNLYFLPDSKVFNFSSIEKPILVFGAGTSVDDFFENYGDFAQKNTFFIIVVDHALKPLLTRKIVPDIVVTVESQLANEKAFIGTNRSLVKNEGYCLAADLTARTNILRYVKKNPNNKISFFFTPFTNANFLQNMNSNLLHLDEIPPMGSVGLYAMKLALNLRKNDAPIFFCGLDFSFPNGKTHCKESPALFLQRNFANRLKSTINVASSYSYGAKKIDDLHYTIPALEGYGNDFAFRFSDEKNLFNLSNIKLGKIENISVKQMKEKLSVYTAEQNNKIAIQNLLLESKASKDDVSRFLETEKFALEKIKESLVNGGMSLDEICEKIDKHDYLYLHFPDGNDGCKCEQSFLNRVRSEIDIFLKIIRP